MTTPEVIFAGTDGGAVTEIAAYEAGGGFTGLARARSMAPAEVIEELNASGLRGRGGAFFPTGRKWSFLPPKEQVPRPHYLVVNADESEPGTFKDREVMLRVPFRFLEGCLIAAHAIESEHVFVYIRGEYEREYEVLVSALEQMRKKKLLRKVTIVLHRGAGAYICGEETALLESLEGKRGQPAHQAPVPRRRRALRLTDRGQQRRVDRHGDADPGDGRRRVREARRRVVHGHARVLALRRRRARWQLRAAARLPAARPHLRASAAASPAAGC